MRIPVTNTTGVPIYVGAAMIPAGETRHFEEADIPAHLRPKAVEAAAEPPKDALLDLSGKPAKEILSAIPDLSDEDLKRLGQLEADKGEKARKTVAAAIQEETLKRAEAAAGSGGKPQE